MPTEEEWKELIDNCTWIRTTPNGVNGTLVTGPNGKSIFLPATGYRVYYSLDDAGSYGRYWSSSLSIDRPDYAWLLNCEGGYVYRYFLGERCAGFSVRPVTE